MKSLSSGAKTLIEWAWNPAAWKVRESIKLSWLPRCPHKTT